MEFSIKSGSPEKQRSACVVVGVFVTASSFLGVALAFWIDPRWGSVDFAALMLLASAQLAVRAVRAGRSGR